MEFWSHFLIWSTLLAANFCQAALIESDSNRSSVSYHELETLGVSCNPEDTCEATSMDHGSHSNCQCDRFCSYFGDCCLDTPNRTISAPPVFSSPVCKKILPNLGYYRVERCMRGWRDAEIKRKCENHPSPRDPLTSVPVIASTAFTYKNHFCATCNNDDDDLVYWKLGMDCPKLNTSMENYILQNLTYNTNRRTWGVYIQHEFYPCSFHPAVPEDERLMRICYPNLVSKCPPNSRDEIVREKCESYTAYLENKRNGVVYRNVHCALCNNVRPNILSCGSLHGRDFERTSFSSLFDINLEKGNAIGGGGTAPKCEKGEVYDLALKRCQKLTCLPFQELRKDRCVNKSGK